MENDRIIELTDEIKSTKRFLWGLGGVVAAGLFGVFLVYGTISPCGILKQRFKSNYLETVTTMAANEKSGFGQVGAYLGLALGNSMIDGMFDTLTPIQCIRGLAKWDAEQSKQLMLKYTSGERIQ